MRIINIRILQLLDNHGSVLIQCTLKSNKHKDELLEVWRKLYGKLFSKCIVQIINNDYATYKKQIK